MIPAKSAGAFGLLRIRRQNGALDGPAAKFLADGAADKLGLADGDIRGEDADVTLRLWVVRMEN